VKKTETLSLPPGIVVPGPSNCSELSYKCDECLAQTASLLCSVKDPVTNFSWNKFLCNTCRLQAKAVPTQKTRSAATVEQYKAAISVAALKECVTEDFDRAWLSRANAERRLERINKLLRKVTADIEVLEKFRV